MWTHSCHRWLAHRETDRERCLVSERVVVVLRSLNRQVPRIQWRIRARSLRRNSKSAPIPNEWTVQLHEGVSAEVTQRSKSESQSLSTTDRKEHLEEKRKHDRLCKNEKRQAKFETHP